MKLVLIGYWAGERAPGWPSPAEFVDPGWDADERDVVADYLRRGFVARSYMGVSPCRICGQPNGALELTDGTYVWPDGFAHYVAEHMVRPPQVFVEHVLASLDRVGEAVHDACWWRSFTDVAGGEG